MTEQIIGTLIRSISTGGKELENTLLLQRTGTVLTGRSYTEKADVRALLRKDENFWGDASPDRADRTDKNAA
jgi:hypothetical protein